jgi:hypothetical protein
MGNIVINHAVPRNAKQRSNSERLYTKTPRLRVAHIWGRSKFFLSVLLTLLNFSASEVWSHMICDHSNFAS